MSASTSCSAHHPGTERQAEAVPDTPKSERDGKGRFIKGNAGGPGNPFNRQVAALRQQVVDALTAERMGRVIEAVMQKAERGDLAAAKLLWQYGLGKPAPTVQPDRMDQEELALYQEQQLSPEAWVQIIKSIPAGMACRMLRPIMPALNQSAAKGIQQLARESGIDVSKAAPSGTKDNGEEAPTGNGDNGNGEPRANGGNEERHNGAGKPSQDAGRHGHASVAMAPVPQGREDAQGAAQSPVRRPGPTQPAPSLTEDNGEEAPMETGVIGERAPSVKGGNGGGESVGNGGNGPKAPVADAVNGGEPLAIGGNGEKGVAGAIRLVSARNTDGANRKLSRKERRAEALRLQRLKAKWGLL